MGMLLSAVENPHIPTLTYLSQKFTGWGFTLNKTQRANKPPRVRKCLLLAELDLLEKPVRATQLSEEDLQSEEDREIVVLANAKQQLSSNGLNIVKSLKKALTQEKWCLLPAPLSDFESLYLEVAFTLLQLNQLSLRKELEEFLIWEAIEKGQKFNKPHYDYGKELKALLAPWPVSKDTFHPLSVIVPPTPDEKEFESFKPFIEKINQLNKDVVSFGKIKEAFKQKDLSAAPPIDKGDAKSDAPASQPKAAEPKNQAAHSGSATKPSVSKVSVWGKTTKTTPGSSPITTVKTALQRLFRK